MASRRVFQRAASPRRMSWEGAIFALTPATGNQTFSTIVSEALLENTPNPTIVRVRGQLLVRITGVGAAIAAAHLTFGIKLVTGQALGIGITAIEHPGTDIGSDWLWWDTRTVRSKDGITDADMSTAQTVRVSIDSKAMRKVPPNKALVLIVQNTVIVSTITATIEGQVRVLLKH